MVRWNFKKTLGENKKDLNINLYWLYNEEILNKHGFEEYEKINIWKLWIMKLIMNGYIYITQQNEYHLLMIKK